MPVTTNAMGAGNWKPEYSQYFEGKQVCIFPDNDTEGESHAEKVAKNLFPVAKAVKIVHLPGLLEKGDFRDWKAAGGTLEEFKKIVKSTPVLTEDDVKRLSSSSSRKAKDKEEASSRGFKLTPLGDLLNEDDEEIPWLVDKHLPSAGLSILGGKPKAGKSVLSRCLALNVARGTPFLDFDTAKGSVFYLGLEEKRSEVKKHFEAMGATPEDPISVFIAPSPQDGVAKLREVAERERPALIIVDPILKMVRVKDSNDYAIMSAALEPLLTLARETGAHVLGVHHLGKGERSRGDSLLGSTAIFAAVDTALFLRRSERYRTLSSIQRYGEDLEEIVLAMDPDTKMITAGGERKEVDERQIGTAIVEYLKDLPEPIDEKEIHEGVEGRKSIKVKALRALVEQDKVLRTGGGKRGNPYLYFVSGSLVPTICREPEYQKRKTEPKCGKESTYSGSRPNPISAPSSDPREPANSPPSGRPKEAVKGTFGDPENDDDVEFLN